MSLDNYPRVECATRFAGGSRAFRGATIPEHILQSMREDVSCKGCGQRIAPGVERVVRGVHVYHPSHDPIRRAAATPPAAPRILGCVGGVAVRFDRGGCCVSTPDGVQHERFAPGCFDTSIARGGQQLQVNHGDTPLRGSFLRLLNDGGELRFKFRLLDGPFERRVLEQVQRGDIGGCSVRFKPIQQRYDYRTIEYLHAELLEISLLTGSKRAAWYGTYAEVVDEW